jgi:hypothetical protein
MRPIQNGHSARGASCIKFYRHPYRFGRESVGSASGPASPILTEQGRRVGSLGPGLACESADARSGCPANRSAGRGPGFSWHPPAVPA